MLKFEKNHREGDCVELASSARSAPFCATPQSNSDSKENASCRFNQSDCPFALGA